MFDLESIKSVRSVSSRGVKRVGHDREVLRALIDRTELSLIKIDELWVRARRPVRRRTTTEANDGEVRRGSVRFGAVR